MTMLYNKKIQGAGIMPHHPLTMYCNLFSDTLLFKPDGCRNRIMLRIQEIVQSPSFTWNSDIMDGSSLEVSLYTKSPSGTINSR